MIERDPHGKNPHEAGAKLDDGKTPASRGLIDYFPRALLTVADVSGHGAERYVWGGWVEVPNAEVRYRDALARHLLQEPMSQYDPGSGMLHMAHIAWNALAILELMQMKREHLAPVPSVLPVERKKP